MKRQRILTVASILAVLGLAVAAPYLIPIDPDSGIFRSGAYGLAILAASYFPVHEGFAQANRRQLVLSGVLGLLFALSLSLGSELRVYDGFLPGMGSLMRRAAVPVLAAPALCGLCARLMVARRLFTAKRAGKMPLVFYAGIIFVCWLPILLAYYPAMLNYDVISEYGQHIEGQYSNLNPLLASLILNATVTLGEMIHSRTFGLLLMSLLQMVCLSLSLGYACAFAQKRHAPRWMLAAMTALFGLHPVFAAMSVSMTKDTLFAAAVVALSLRAWEFLEAPEAFCKRKEKVISTAVFAVGSALLRNNGVFALALLLPGLIVAAKGQRKRAALLAAVCASASLAVFFALQLGLHPKSMPGFQFYSLPAQQLVRAYNLGKMSDVDKAALRDFYVDDQGLIVHPHLADGAKGYLDNEKLKERGGEFLALWARNAVPCAKEYAEALLMLNVGSWYPDDLSHSTIYPDASWSDKGYLQTQEYDMSYCDFETHSYLPKLQKLYERICRQNRYQKYPLVPILFCPATPLWMTVLACFVLAARRKARFIPAALGVLGLWLSYLLGPCTLPRYALPIFATSPALLAASLGRAPEGEAQKETVSLRKLLCPKQFAAGYALCAVLLLAFASPYLNPVNPDSPVFHSAVLPALLALGCFFGVRRALVSCSMREMIFGLIFGFIFALCLSVGCELMVYDGLLPGMGSLVRRAAVPVMATPALGMLAALLFAAKPKKTAITGKRIPGWVFFLVFALCYTALLLCFFPGVVSYDFEHEMRQFTTGVYEAAHPVFHTMLLCGLYRLGEMVFGTMTAGAALYSVAQLLLLAAMYARACCFLQKRVPLWATLLAAAGFALLPFHGILGISTAKDPLFSGLCVLLCLAVWAFAEDAQAFLASRKRMAGFVLCCVLMSLLRHNAVFAVLPACLALPALARGMRRPAAGVAALSLALSFLLPLGLEKAVHAEKTPSTELMSVPCQQLMRVGNREQLTEEQFTEISEWFSYATGRYRPHIADPAKGGNFDSGRFNAHPEEYWSMWAKYARLYPRTYVEAFLENCAGLWNPSDVSHAHALSSEEYDFIYLNTTYPFAPDAYPIQARRILKPLAKIVYRSTHHADHQDIPFISLLFCPAAYSFAMLFGCMRLALRKKKGYVWATMPLLGIFLSLLFSAGVFVRYAYPIMAGTPLLVLLTMFL